MFYECCRVRRFQIELTDDGTYAAIHVTHCTASTSPIIPDDDADTAVLLIDRCERDVIFNTHLTYSSFIFNCVLHHIMPVHVMHMMGLLANIATVAVAMGTVKHS